MTDYKFPARIKRLELIRIPDFEIEKPPRERGEIMGIMASFAEWVVALVFWYLKIEFFYYCGQQSDLATLKI